jgi:hypothetical protein
MWTAALGTAAVTAAVVSYEHLSRGRPATPAALAILDEAHHARNPRTRRYAALARLTFGARILLLTATPLHNRASDLRALLALFLGASAYTLGIEQLLPCIVRRRHGVLDPGSRVPRAVPSLTLPVSPAPRLLREIRALPPGLPAADEGAADALLRLGLLRAWTSSDAAVRAALRRRLHRAAALEHALASGRLPTKRQLAAWSALDGSLQLAFPELVADRAREGTDGLLRTVAAHATGVRRILDALDAGPANDAARARHLDEIATRHRGERIVAFTQFQETARAMFVALRARSGVALVTSRGARIASGTVSRQEVIRHFGAAVPPVDPRRPLDLLIATDVLSEGLNLQGASVLVHLDLPWTVVRLEQRLGRLRRMGAPHDRVNVYAIGPPPDARELHAIIRVLQRKARLLLTYTGDADAVGQAPLLSAHGRSRSRPGDDLTGKREELREIFRGWRERYEGATASRLDGALVAAVRSAAVNVSWEALALTRSGHRPRLIAVAPTHVSEHPASLVRLAQLASVAQSFDAMSSDPRAACAIADACRVVRRWCDEQRGGALTAPVRDAPSPAHARVLRRLAELAASVPRHMRSELACEVTDLRRIVVALRGAGAELVLREWMEEDVARGDVPRSSRLARLRDLLAPAVTSRSGEQDPANVSVAAIVVLLAAQDDPRATPGRGVEPDSAV